MKYLFFAIVFFILLMYSNANCWDKIELTDSRIYDMIFMNNDTGFLINQNGQIFRTFNQGINWDVSVDFSPLRLTTMTKDINNNLWVNATNNSNKCYSYISSNFGTSWNNVRTIDIAALPTDIKFDNHFGIMSLVQFSSTLLEISHNGSDWTSFENIPGTKVSNIFLIDSNHFWLCGTGAYLTNYVNLIPDKKVITGFEQNEWRDIYFNQSIGFVCGSNGAIIKTTNAGLTFIASNIGIPATCTFYGIIFVNDKLGYVCGVDSETKNGVIYFTSDSGNMWTLEYEIPNFIFLDFARDANNLWVYGTNGALFKKLLPTDIDEDYSNYIDEITYTNNQLTFDPKLYKMIESVSISDLSGRLQSNLFKDDLINPINISESKLTNGLYLVVIHTKNRKLLKKIICN